MIKYFCFILIIALSAISCLREDKYVIETDYGKIMPDPINGETQEESNKKSQEFYKELISNTIDKSIPDVEIINEAGEILNLRNVLNSETIIISADNHCSWGLECLTKDFPNALTEISNINFRVICLLKTEKSDINNAETFNKTLEELKQIYESVYIIEENESRKINLFANPTRLYINKDKIVTHIGLGASLSNGRLFNEIKENTGAINSSYRMP